MKNHILLIALLAFCIPFVLTGQNTGSNTKKKMTVIGVIIGPDSKPVTGASIYVDRIHTGTLTDGLGRFRVKVSSDARKLIASSPDYGYGQAEIVKDKEVYIKLNGDTKNLEAFLAENTNPLTPKEQRIVKMNTYNDIYQMIRNEVPGVMVNGKSIVVQQQNSFFGSTTPLFLVNGIRVSSIDNINPREVKSIELLKGSYANIYGNEGANGVISITLKTGADK